MDYSTETAQKMTRNRIEELAVEIAANSKGVRFSDLEKVANIILESPDKLAAAIKFTKHHGQVTQE